MLNLCITWKLAIPAKLKSLSVDGPRENVVKRANGVRLCTFSHLAPAVNLPARVAALRRVTAFSAGAGFTEASLEEASLAARDGGWPVRSRTRH